MPIAELKRIFVDLFHNHMKMRTEVLNMNGLTLLTIRNVVYRSRIVIYKAIVSNTYA